ncbi:MULTISPECIES: glycosyltransferase family 2 protein [unclassified Arthrobacter]|uniref:glycosyltransferase family 2 protein n=1 Tax=unclassified Arthrobacter TaxID=235627 RepID=UPI0006F8D7A3|nr:glycosyltransferase family 2 protein [Arthrobacter sp. Leaf234]KQO04039.1 glycosyl transferase family 2 [Arthrobacter sp. Leaf234]
MGNRPPSGILIVMPAWNEAEAIGDTIRDIKRVEPDMDILVVDDGSRDDTARIAEDAGAVVLRLPFNLGVGGAMRTGFKYALRNGYSGVIQVDSDGQHMPEDIAKVLQGLESADISIGARFAGKGEYQAKGPRRWAMSLLARVISRVAGTRLTDVTSGFRAVNRRGLHQYIEHFPAEYLGDTIDSLVVALKSGCTVTQVPVEMRVRQAGTPSQSPWKASIYLARSGLVLCFALARRRTMRDYQAPSTGDIAGEGPVPA